MRLSEEEIGLVTSGDQKTIQKLLDQYLYMVKSPVYEVVLTLRRTIDNWCGEIVEKQPSIIGSDRELDSKIKEVEMVRKLLLDLPQLVLDCEKLQAKLTGDDLVNLQQDKRIKEGEDRPFKTRQQS